MWRLAATLLVVVTLVVDRGARQVRAAGPAFDDDDDDNRVGLIHSFIHSSPLLLQTPYGQRVLQYAYITLGQPSLGPLEIPHVVLF